MRWTKRGLLFEPSRHGLPPGCIAYAQSPQALLFEDFVRVYFSTRQLDHTGKFLSHVTFVDCDREMRTVLGAAQQPVIALGGRGCFDEHGIFPMHVVRDGGAVYAFTSGWSRRTAVSVDTAIGLAVSGDEGRTFQRLGPGPVMGATLQEPFLVGDPFVLIENALWCMWYIFGVRWLRPHDDRAPPERVYKIALATSRDGRSWQRNGEPIIVDRLGPNECQALPTVLRHDGRYHMLFCYRHATDFRATPARGYRLGYAWSTDGVKWTRDDTQAGIDVSPSGWDSEMLCYPHLFRCGSTVFLLYNGNHFGREGFGVAVLES